MKLSIEHIKTATKEAGEFLVKKQDWTERSINTMRGFIALTTVHHKHLINNVGFALRHRNN